MSKTFQDENFLVWEAFPSGGSYGFDEDVKIIFHCVTDRRMRPRFIATDEDSADAEEQIQRASAPDLLALLKRSREID
jgi:hypothetical protein